MGLFSFLNKNKQQAPVQDSGFYSADDVARAKRASHAGASAQSGAGRGKEARRGKEAADPVLPEKKRARRRLVGAVALALGVAIGLPMLLDSEPKPLVTDIAIQIPSKDRSGAAEAGNASSQVAAGATLDQSEEIVTLPVKPASKGAAEPESPAAPPLAPAPAASKAESRLFGAPTSAAPTPAAPTPAAPTPAAPKHEARSSESKLADTKPEVKPAEPKFVEPTPAAPTPAAPTPAAPTPAAPKREAKAVEPKAPELKHEAAKPAEAKRDVKTVETRPAEVKHDVKAAEARPGDSRAPDAVRALSILEGKPGTPEPHATKYVIQVAALASQEKVDELQARLKDAGIKYFIQKVPTAAGERTRVRVGPFPNREEAEKMRARLIKSGLGGTLVPA